MKKIKITIISIFLFFTIATIGDLLLRNISSIYYNCFSTFPEAGYDICTRSPFGIAISLILSLGVAVWYFYKSLSAIKSNQNVKN
ncbi:MAG: hypothetical protein Q8N87_01960 [bacterium]|nr:hypothetical protein [bacterium]